MRTLIARVALYSFAVLMLVVMAQRSLLATLTPSAPEVDSSTLSAGVALVAAGVLIVRSRMKSK